MRKIVSGIYQIVNTQNGHKYIGSSKDTYKRWQGHREHLLRNKHHSPYLQRAWNLYSEASFVFEVIEECLIVDLITREQFYIDTVKPEYNICPTASSRKGAKMTAEAIARMAERLRGVKHTPEQNQKKSEYMKKAWESRKGWTHSEETKKLIGKKGEGRIPTDEARKNLSEAVRLAWAEGRRKGVKSSKKRTMPPPTEEARRNMSEAGKRRRERERLEKSQINCEETARNGE